MPGLYFLARIILFKIKYSQDYYIILHRSEIIVRYNYKTFVYGVNIPLFAIHIFYRKKLARYVYLYIIIFSTWCHFFVLASKVRLSSSPYEGYFQVFDGSIWRYVGENNWDKNRQKMFCEYLGFNDTDASIAGGTFNRRNDIATGHFICYKTQTEEISCCVHLKPSNQDGTSIPYVKCKNTYVRYSKIAFAANHFVCGYILLINYYVSVHVGFHA